MSEYHTPVMLEECLYYLQVKEGDIVVDATFGGGGHSINILKKLDSSGFLYAFDRDYDSNQNILIEPNFRLIHQNYSNLSSTLNDIGILQVDAILADLGVSSHQLNNAERGFSYQSKSVLDMRMNQDQELTAFDVVNSYSKDKLSYLFYHYGDIKNANKIAQHVVVSRENSLIKTTDDLNRVFGPFLPKYNEFRILSRLYQALRIEVNNEIQHLEKFLLNSIDLLAIGGRLVVLSYHSLEDRLIKNIMKSGNLAGKIEKDFYGNTISPWIDSKNKFITPSKNEIINNPRSRSAKLRFAIKK